ncbi:UNC93-like protein MFSD11 [Holothuria leucospilota]|uniref:UNC93-like protein MFSD11 n=1 Tax=Holothuria leucospilota TaxID=206669 RepID=A0A9Q1C1N6_HOLLE|nr:UNC93-like protein MFSD11 [Holothuria leucospilota]
MKTKEHETVIESWAKNQTNPDASKSLGYDSLAIIYAVFAISNWIAPLVVSLIGPRFSMFGSGIIYSGFIFSFLYIQPWLLLTLSTFLGVAAAENVRTIVFSVLGGVSVVGVLLFLVLIPVRGIARLSGEDVDAVAINTE